MRKAISISVLLFLFLTISVQASPLPREHSIVEYTMAIHINGDGSARVEERIANRFVGQFNGVFLDVDYRGFGNLVDFSVYEYLPETDEYIYFTHEQRADVGDDGVFLTTGQGGSRNFQVFSPSVDEYRTFVYRYTLTQAASRFLDAGQFNRTLIRSELDLPIEAYQVIVTFDSAPPHSGELAASLYVSGEVHWNFTSATNDIRIHSYGDMLLPGQNLGVNAIFPAEWLPDADIINRGINDAPFPWGILAIVIIAAIVIIIIVVIVVLSKPHKVDFTERYYEQLPSDKGPALMAYLVRRNGLKISDVLAALLNMTKCGILTIENNDHETDNYNFTYNAGQGREMVPHEEYLITWLFIGIGNGTSVSLQDIQQVGKDEEAAVLFHEQFNGWVEAVKAEADKLGYFESIWRRSPHGELEYRKWLAFKRYLDNLTTIGQSGIKAHEFWDEFLPYALSLGSANELVKILPKIPKPMESDEWDTHNILWFNIIGPQMLNICDYTFNGTYASGQNYAASQDYGSAVSSTSSGGSSAGSF